MNISLCDGCVKYNYYVDNIRYEIFIDLENIYISNKNIYYLNCKKNNDFDVFLIYFDEDLNNYCIYIWGYNINKYINLDLSNNLRCFTKKRKDYKLNINDDIYKVLEDLYVLFRKLELSKLMILMMRDRKKLPDELWKHISVNYLLEKNDIKKC